MKSISRLSAISLVAVAGSVVLSAQPMNSARVEAEQVGGGPVTVGVISWDWFAVWLGLGGSNDASVKAYVGGVQ